MHAVRPTESPTSAAFRLRGPLSFNSQPSPVQDPRRCDGGRTPATWCAVLTPLCWRKLKRIKRAASYSDADIVRLRWTFMVVCSSAAH